jgi:tRNA(fMet)-specific endonuclease VapC
MKFLDTSFLIDVIRKHAPVKTLLDNLDKEGPHVTNTIVAHEFLVGAFGATNSEMELKARNDLLSRIVILEFDLAAANRSAVIEANLRAKGEMIGGADILIAGTMISRGISTIVTKNTRHFEKIPLINIQTW